MAFCAIGISFHYNPRIPTNAENLLEPALTLPFQVSLTESLNEASALQDEDGFPEIMETMVNFEQFDEYLRGGVQYSPSARCAIEEDYFAKAGEEFAQGDNSGQSRVALI